MKKQILNNLEGKVQNHLFPFFWQHGDDDKTILKELRRIYDCGIKGICVESRVHKDFMGPEWFEDIRLILEECKKLGMDFWLLDDKCYPTGIANYQIRDKYPHLGKRAITERHVDVAGPIYDGAVLYSHFLGENDRLIGIVACERTEGDGQKMTGKVIDITQNTKDGVVFFDLPEGFWRIFILFETKYEDNYIDMLREESVQVLLDAVYEPHYAELKEYFGSTFKGFFTDEAFIMIEARLPIGDECVSKGKFPWNENVERELESVYGSELLLNLPALWFPSENQAKIRIDYMDTVTKLYRKCFSFKLGNWCKDHNVEYIGHIVEDDGMHTKLRSVGHYFRALDGQDMAGIDVVLCQIVPGMANNDIAVPCFYDIADHEFFHFGLAKLASSHAHIQAKKKGRAMCEIFGAYGWAEGLPMMKWLCDHMLVRGINEFVPHAFSPKYPNTDAPPHFYAKGNNPEFEGFKLLMGYVNRVASILSGGKHHATCAILYHAEAEWSGGKYMKFEKVAKLLTEAQLDFDIISEDYIASSEMKNGVMKLEKEEYPVIIVPYTEIITRKMAEDLLRAEKAGIKVVFIDEKPLKDEEGNALVFNNSVTVKLCEIADYMKNNGFADVLAQGENIKNLRYYHYSKGDTHCVFLTNEGKHKKVKADISLKDFSGGKYIKYYPLENKAYTCEFYKKLDIELEEYNSVMLFFGDIPDIDFATKKIEESFDFDAKWNISFAKAIDYDAKNYPSEGIFTNEKEIDAFYNIARENPRFTGFVKYETTVNLEKGKYKIDLGKVGEEAKVFVNKKLCGDRIIPPYNFEFETENGENLITVITASHLGYFERDRFSAFLTLEPVGLLGPVTLSKIN